MRACRKIKTVIMYLNTSLNFRIEVFGKQNFLSDNLAYIYSKCLQKIGLMMCIKP